MNHLPFRDSTGTCSSQASEESNCFDREKGTVTPILYSDKGIETTEKATDGHGGSAIVDFQGPDDPSRPVNWKMSKKVYTCFLYGLLNMGATWATSR